MAKVLRVKVKKGAARKGADNPKGRPKGYREFRALARTYSEEAMEKLVYWMRSNDSKASISAAKEILNRSWGRPEVTANINLPDGMQFGVLRVNREPQDLESWSKRAQKNYEEIKEHVMGNKTLH